MRKNLMFLMTFVLMFGLVSSASAASVTTIWTNGALNQDWSTAGNWNPQVPDNDDKATFEPGPAGAIIDFLDAVTVLRVALGHNNPGVASSLTMNGGTLVTTSEVYIGGDVSSAIVVTGIFNMNGGTVTVGPTSDKFFIGYYSTGYFNMTAGSVTSGRVYLAGDKDNSTGYATISGGTVNATTRLRVGGKAGSKGYLTLTGGEIITPIFEIAPTSATTIGEVYLDGGIIRAGTFSMGSQGYMDIDLGSLLVAGNQVASIQAYITAGKITAWDGYGQVLVNYHPCLDKTIVNAIIPEPATMTLLGLGGMLLLRRRK